MPPPSRPGPPARPHAPLPPHPTPGALAAGNAQLRQRLSHALALERYDLSVLRLGGIAPPTLPRGVPPTARDGDLARVDARQRYDQLLSTQQQHVAALRQAHRPAAEYTMSQTPADDYHRPGMAERRVAAYQAAQAHAQHLADHPLEATVGEGVVIGNSIVASTALSEVALLRLVGGQRWARAARAAVAARSLTLAEGAETGMFGVRAGWQGLRQAPGLAVSRGVIDTFGQGIVSYSTSDKVGWGRVSDAAYGVNLSEVGLSVYGMRPFGASLFSSAFQYSVNDGYRSVFNHRISVNAFAAQVVIGTGVGHLGEYGGRVLNRHLAYGLFQGTAGRMGYDLGYPVWLGSKHGFQYGMPIGFGALGGYYQALADKQWPGLPKAAPLPTSSHP